MLEICNNASHGYVKTLHSDVLKLRFLYATLTWSGSGKDYSSSQGLDGFVVTNMSRNCPVLSWFHACDVGAAPQTKASCPPAVPHGITIPSTSLMWKSGEVSVEFSKARKAAEPVTSIRFQHVWAWQTHWIHCWTLLSFLEILHAKCTVKSATVICIASWVLFRMFHAFMYRTEY